MPNKSIRLHARANGDRTLSGYIFTDLRHARAWLRQSFVKPEDYSLDAVEIGESHRCTRCDGSGFTQTVKAVGSRMTVDDFLAEKINAG